MIKTFLLVTNAPVFICFPALLVCPMASSQIYGIYGLISHSAAVINLLGGAVNHQG